MNESVRKITLKPKFHPLTDENKVLFLSTEIRSKLYRLSKITDTVLNAGA